MLVGYVYPTQPGPASQLHVSATTTPAVSTRIPCEVIFQIPGITSAVGPSVYVVEPDTTGATVSNTALTLIPNGCALTFDLYLFSPGYARLDLALVADVAGTPLYPTASLFVRAS